MTTDPRAVDDLRLAVNHVLDLAAQHNLPAQAADWFTHAGEVSVKVQIPTLSTPVADRPRLVGRWAAAFGAPVVVEQFSGEVSVKCRARIPGGLLTVYTFVPIGETLTVEQVQELAQVQS